MNTSGLTGASELGTSLVRFVLPSHCELAPGSQVCQGLTTLGKEIKFGLLP